MKLTSIKKTDAIVYAVIVAFVIIIVYTAIYSVKHPSVLSNL